MNYGNLSQTYCITATDGRAINYYYFTDKDQADRAEKSLIKEGYETTR